MVVSFRSAITAGRGYRAFKSAVVTQTVRHGSVYKAQDDFKPPHLDEMPVPSGSWLAYHKMKQSNYNRQLIAGILYFGFTIAYILKSGRLFFNAFPPSLEEGELATFTPPAEC